MMQPLLDSNDKLLVITVKGFDDDTSTRVDKRKILSRVSRVKSEQFDLNVKFQCVCFPCRALKMVFRHYPALY
jgi:hypothetical protein